MDDMVQYVSKDRPVDRDEMDIVSWTLRIDYESMDVYNEYADEIEGLIRTKFGALGAMNFRFIPMRSSEPIVQEVEYVPGCLFPNYTFGPVLTRIRFKARVGVADDLEAIKLGNDMYTSLWYNGH